MAGEIGQFHHGARRRRSRSFNALPQLRLDDGPVIFPQRLAYHTDGEMNANPRVQPGRRGHAKTTGAASRCQRSTEERGGQLRGDRRGQAAGAGVAGTDRAVRRGVRVIWSVVGSPGNKHRLDTLGAPDTSQAE
jgi:hypothetical protein